MPMQVELPVNGPERDASGSSARLAIFLSAAVCPGAGHFVQRRWILGMLYLAAFLACLVMMLFSVAAVIVPWIINQRIALDFAETGSNAPFRTVPLPKIMEALKELLIWLGLTVLVWLAALVDISTYARRQVRRRLDVH